MNLKDWGTNYLTVEYPHLTAWLESILLYGVDDSFPTDYRAYEDLTNENKRLERELPNP